MLVIKAENYPIKIGAEVFNVEYPSFNQAQQIAKEFDGKTGGEAVKLMKDWLIKLGLTDDFFNKEIIKSKHIMTIWGDINSIKK